jgi:putative endonuclease
MIKMLARKDQRHSMIIGTKTNTKTVGNLGEDIACKFLVKNGFVIEARNYRRKWGELDIVACKKTVHFFEVKSVVVHSLDNIRDDKAGGLNIKGHSPEENVHNLKTRHIRRMVETYLNDHYNGQDVLFEFHVLCVFLDQKKRVARVKWLKNLVL